MNRRIPSRLATLLVLGWACGCGSASDPKEVSIRVEGGADATAVPEGCDGRGEAFTLPVTATAEGFAVVLTAADPPLFSLGDNAWKFRIEAPDGGVLAGQDPVVVPWMPDHRHGSPRTVLVTDLGEGTYEARPINANMPGLWEVRVNLPGDGGEPPGAVFSFCVVDR